MQKRSTPSAAGKEVAVTEPVSGYQTTDTAGDDFVILPAVNL